MRQNKNRAIYMYMEMDRKWCLLQHGSFLLYRLVRHITINNKEHKISQYADDTQLLLDGSEESFRGTFLKESLKDITKCQV